MKIGLNIGHFGTIGAEGFLSEVKCNTEIYEELLPLLQRAGHEVIPCNDAMPQDFVSATKLANKYTLDLVISLHCNSHSNESANGTEVMYYDGNSEGKKLALKISESISKKIGTKNRGCVPTKSIYILSKTKATAILVESFFVSSKADCEKYDAKKIAAAIANVFGYKEEAAPKNKYSYDDTVENMILDGITTTENMQYWEKVLDGKEPVNLEYLRTLLNKYSAKLREKK